MRALVLVRIKEDVAYAHVQNAPFGWLSSIPGLRSCAKAVKRDLLVASPVNDIRAVTARMCLTPGLALGSMACLRRLRLLPVILLKAVFFPGTLVN